LSLNEVGLFSFLRCKVFEWIEDFYWVVYGSLLCVLCPCNDLLSTVFLFAEPMVYCCSEAENEDKTVEEAKSWTEIVLEDDATVPFNTSVCCKEVFISHPALDKHMSVAHNDTNAPCVRRPLQGINKQQYTMGSAKRKTVERRSLQGQRTHKREP
jgi:hypothetical protein